MATPYRIIAKDALINWNGLSEEEAISKMNTETVDQLEGQVHAISAGSFPGAVYGLCDIAGLNNEEREIFYNAALNGPEDHEIFSIVASRVSDISYDQIIEICSSIHDAWLQNNCNEKTFNKKYDRQQLRQYAPIELIGWNEVESDLLFLNPVLASVGIQVDENMLSDAYHEAVSNYFNDLQINSIEDLISLIGQGKEYYPALPDELNAKLSPLSQMVAMQMVKNWMDKDPQTVQIFQDRVENLGNIAR